MYNHSRIEKKWRKNWEQHNIYKFVDKGNKKYYVLDMFPYPSGQGLHVGHPKGYTASDIIARYKKLCGYDVLHPIGWDAFGLPAEQYALDTGNHPKIFTQQNINNFREQLKKIGFSYDYNKEVDTTDKNYYKWTQWIFIQLLKNGLASIENVDVNWCEKLGTVLANEEVLKDEKGNPISERGGFPVVKKPMKQWVLKITKYANRLIDDLDLVDWPEGLKNIQKKWIGRSTGAIIRFKIDNSDKYIDIFTTKPQTIYGVSFIGISPEYKNLEQLIDPNNEEIKSFINIIKNKKDYERTKIDDSKKGIFTGKYALHPLTKELIPIWISEYVLAHYGTGCIMGVPNGDERDLAFAKTNNIEIKTIYNENKLINSYELNNLDVDLAYKNAIELIKAKKIGCEKTTFKLRDWLFSRQRYWGEPFPVIYDENGKIAILKNLPVQLPKTKNVKPSCDGTSPLSNLKQWLYIEIDGKKYKRDTNTMPQWAGSCWYYLAYILKNEDGSYTDLNSQEAFNRFKRWLPVDCYIGGQEHAVLHLLYARFWHKFLYDIKIVPTKEPFQLIINQGMILDQNGIKMSKSKNNVINPDDVIEIYGADSLRMYEMFMGPLTSSLPWNDDSLHGVRKWLDRVYNYINKYKDDFAKEDDDAFNFDYHLFIKNVTNNLDKLQFNLAISDMMIFINACHKFENKVSISQIKSFLIVLSTFAPFLADELNEMMKNNDFLYNSKWPTYDEKYLIINNIKIPVKIDNKVREILEVKNNISENEIIDIAFNNEKITNLIKKEDVDKIIYVKNKILNIISKKR